MSDQNLKVLIEESRGILESKGELCPAYVGFEKEEYVLSKDEIQKIAKCLYLIDCEINQDNNE